MLKKKVYISKVESNAMSAPKYGQNLKQIRIKLGLTRQSLATLLDVDADKIKSYEEARNDIPLEHVEKLCLFYNLEYDLFFENADFNEESQNFHEHKKHKSYH